MPGGFAEKGETIETTASRELEEETGVKFLDIDFKKKNGFGRSVELSKKYGLYRQNFCGCDFARYAAK